MKPNRKKSGLRQGASNGVLRGLLRRPPLTGRGVGETRLLVGCKFLPAGVTSTSIQPQAASWSVHKRKTCSVATSNSKLHRVYTRYQYIVAWKLIPGTRYSISCRSYYWYRVYVDVEGPRQRRTRTTTQRGKACLCLTIFNTAMRVRSADQTPGPQRCYMCIQLLYSWPSSYAFDISSSARALYLSIMLRYILVAVKV